MIKIFVLCVFISDLNVLLAEGSYLVDLTLSTRLDADVSVFQTDSL